MEEGVQKARGGVGWGNQGNLNALGYLGNSAC